MKNYSQNDSNKKILYANIALFIFVFIVSFLFFLNLYDINDKLNTYYNVTKTNSELIEVNNKQIKLNDELIKHNKKLINLQYKCIKLLDKKTQKE